MSAKRGKAPPWRVVRPLIAAGCLSVTLVVALVGAQQGASPPAVGDATPESSAAPARDAAPRGAAGLGERGPTNPGGSFAGSGWSRFGAWLERAAARDPTSIWHNGRDHRGLTAPPHVGLHRGDLRVLEDLIAVSGLDEDASRLDFDDGDGRLEPVEFGLQVWQGGRLVMLATGPTAHASFGYRLERIPESVGELHALRLLDLSANRIRVLPETLAGLGQLEELRLHSNALRSLPRDLGALAHMRTLTVGDNPLATLPDSIADLGRLQELHANESPLVTLPVRWQGLDRLEILNLAWTRPGTTRGRLTRLPDDLGRLAALRELHLAGLRLACGDSTPDRPPPASQRFLHDGSIERVYGLEHQDCRGASDDTGTEDGTDV